MEGDECILPNYPKGYKFEPWSIDEIMGDLKEGKEVDLGAGEWL
jgi:hypothetical protein